MSDPVAFSRALADATRWRIVTMALDEALCVCELADILGMPQSSVSSHVQVIRKAGLLESEKREKWTYFRVLPEHRRLIRAIGERFPGMEDTRRKDAEKLAERLVRRSGSCCPGPVRLATRIRRKPSTTP